jgi:hypothetical protein
VHDSFIGEVVNVVVLNVWRPVKHAFVRAGQTWCRLGG